MIVKELSIEELSEKELQKADVEARRAENLIKHKEEIMNRPKKHWMKNTLQKKELKQKSKDDLKDIKSKFEKQFATGKIFKKKRDLKFEQKQTK